MIFDEKHILYQAKHGDREAFATLVEAYQAQAYRVALRMGLNPTDAEEAAQDAFVAAWRGLPQFREECQFSTWLYRLTANAAIDIQRREKRHRAEDIEEIAAVDERETPQQMVERRDTAEAVRHAVKQLPDEFRQVVVLRYLEDLSYQEIAAVLHLPAGTVKSRINRGKAQLKRILTMNGNLLNGDAVQSSGEEEQQ